MKKNEMNKNWKYAEEWNKWRNDTMQKNELNEWGFDTMQKNEMNDELVKCKRMKWMKKNW